MKLKRRTKQIDRHTDRQTEEKNIGIEREKKGSTLKRSTVLGQLNTSGGRDKETMIAYRMKLSKPILTVILTMSISRVFMYADKRSDIDRILNRWLPVFFFVHSFI